MPRSRNLGRRCRASTAEAEVKGVNALLNFNSRPFRNLSFNARYRYNERDVQTPSFDATEYVRFDAVPEEIGKASTHQFDVTRQTFDATATFSMNRLRRAPGRLQP